MPSELQDNALIGVNDWKTWTGLEIGDPVMDGILIDAINLASDEIEGFCNRVFRQEAITDELHDGCGWPFLRVQRPPIEVDTLVLSTRVGAGEWTVMDAALYVVNWERGLISLLDPCGAFQTGVQNIKVDYTGGFATMPTRIVNGARMLASKHYYGRARDASVEQESAGTFSRSYSYGIPDEVACEVGKYKLTRMAAVARR